MDFVDENDTVKAGHKLAEWPTHFQSSPKRYPSLRLVDGVSMREATPVSQTALLRTVLPRGADSALVRER